MEFDFAEVLLQVMERNASDLHLTAGSPPMITTTAGCTRWITRA